MAETRDDFTWIELYLAGELTEAEQDLFQQRLEAEPALRGALREQQEALIAMRLLEKETLKAQLKQDWEGMKEKVASAPVEEAPVRSGRVRQLAWAIAIAAGIALLFWVLRPQTTPLSVKELAMAQFDPAAGSLGRGGDQTDSLRKAAETQYREQQYPAAADSYLAMLKADPGDKGAQFYLAMSQFANGETAPAISAFEALLADPLYDEHARWNLSLAYLVAGELDKATALLGEISQRSGHYKSEAAGALLGELN